MNDVASARGGRERYRMQLDREKLEDVMGYDPIPDAVTPEAVRERDRYVADIRAIFPRARWPEIDFMLWNMTAWPICGNSEAIRQLSEIRAECGSDAKRGWWRKVGRMANRIDRECYQAGLDHAKAKRATAPSASAAQESSS